MLQQTKFLDHDGIKCKANPWVFPKELRSSGGPGDDGALTSFGNSFIFLRMSNRHAPSSAAIELALFGVTALCVADIHCC